jgi:hypothetical protein
MKPKYYFLSENSEQCYTLQKHTDEAKEQVLTEIECNKSCPPFKRTEGRFCDYRGKFYTPGKKVTFKVK